MFCSIYGTIKEMKTLPDLNEIQYFSWVAQTEDFKRNH